MKPTPEQDAICEAVGRGENCMVDALAGCAKSHTLKLALQTIPPEEPTAIVAFNKKVKEDMEKDIKKLGLARDNLSVLTMNGLGHKAIAQSLRRRPEVDNDKIFKLVKDMNFRRQDFSDVMALAKAARHAGIVPKGIAGRSLLPDTEETWAEIADTHDIDPIFITPAREVLIKSTRMALQGVLDFDDQIYVSTLIFGSYPRYPHFFVDESQDLSPLNHIQVHKAAAGQIVAVGDPHQSIYAWRGADYLSMQNLRKLRDQWTDLTLSTTFRCPKAVVERQHWMVPRFTAAEGNATGIVRSLDEWRPGGGASSAVLCRNNAPLIKLAFRLLRERVPITYLGKDIGANLKRLYNKLSNNGANSIDTTIANAWALGKGDPDKLDKCECLVAILESHKTVEEAMDFLTIARTDSIALATGHKAKGLEWDRVYHLNRWLIPNRHVSDMPEGPDRDAAMQQEDNLNYVIETRTRNELFFVNLEDLADAD